MSTGEADSRDRPEDVPRLSVESWTDLEGWLPWRCRPERREVELVDATVDLDFSLPFFHMTTAPLEEPDCDARRAVITFDQLRDLTGTEIARPAAMVFHIGRCGSTLVSRIIGCDPKLLVLREAGPIGSLHRGGGGSVRVPTYTLERALNDVLVAFEHLAAGRDQRLAVKHSSWESFSMGRLGEILPDVPFVFCHRDVEEVVESSLDGYPGWGGRLHHGRRELQRWVPWLDRIEGPYTAAQVFASVWAAGAAAALSLPPERVLLIEYHRMVDAPESVIDELARHVALSDDFDREAARAQLGHYSKAPKAVDFDPTGRHAHPQLTARTAAQVRDVVGDLPDRLADRLRDQAARLGTALEPVS